MTMHVVAGTKLKTRPLNQLAARYLLEAAQSNNLQDAKQKVRENPDQIIYMQSPSVDWSINEITTVLQMKNSLVHFQNQTHFESFKQPIEFWVKNTSFLREGTNSFFKKGCLDFFFKHPMDKSNLDSLFNWGFRKQSFANIENPIVRAEKFNPFDKSFTDIASNFVKSLRDTLKDHEHLNIESYSFLSDSLKNGVVTSLKGLSNVKDPGSLLQELLDSKKFLSYGDTVFFFTADEVHIGLLSGLDEQKEQEQEQEVPEFGLFIHGFRAACQQKNVEA